MRLRGLSTVWQILIGVLWIVLLIVAAIQEASISVMWVFGIVMCLSLLILCTGSRRWGTIVGIVLYGLLVLYAYMSILQCSVNAQPGIQSYCNLGELYYLFGLVLIPLGALLGGGVGWIVGKMKGKKEAIVE